MEGRNLLYAALVLIVILGIGLALLNPQQPACTADAMLCPDGSYVGRVPPDCNFAPCPQGNGTQQGIIDFEGCAAAGYPVLESYPRQCSTPDGKVFISTSDFFASDMNASCASDDDCVLVDSSLDLRCCWRGYCDAIDYSESKWVAVNAVWFNSARDRLCPSVSDCGPAPGCATMAVNLNYTAKCEIYRCGPEEKCIGANRCEKVPKTQ